MTSEDKAQNKVIENIPAVSYVCKANGDFGATYIREFNFQVQLNRVG
ncbi:hypothetical protein JV46_14210 [Solemya velum gill symbiont]|uniref:Uncharacterized protein n=1 Tax=Solemya velum gill symbiont TaxID=2340 RepID=A0A0B0H789_SOVGS|nr:hypothetical protein JV46_14210 [Solemya velum gill symbiont]